MPILQVSIGFAAGILLGLTWRVVVLYPATLLIVLLLISAGGLNWSNATLILAVIAALQAGYLSGAAAREFVHPARSANWWRVLFHRH
jgi:hypothetical protein